MPRERGRLADDLAKLPAQDLFHANTSKARNTRAFLRLHHLRLCPCWGTLHAWVEHKARPATEGVQVMKNLYKITNRAGGVICFQVAESEADAVSFARMCGYKAARAIFVRVNA